MSPPRCLRVCWVCEVESLPTLKTVHGNPLPPGCLTGCCRVPPTWLRLRVCEFCEFYLSLAMKNAKHVIYRSSRDSTAQNSQTRKPNPPDRGSSWPFRYAGTNGREIPLGPGFRAYLTGRTRRRPCCRLTTWAGWAPDMVPGAVFRFIRRDKGPEVLAELRRRFLAWLALRDHYLTEAAALLEGPSTWQRCRQLAGAARAFEVRRWPIWRRLDAPPSHARACRPSIWLSAGLALRAPASSRGGRVAMGDEGARQS